MALSKRIAIFPKCFLDCWDNIWACPLSYTCRIMNYRIANPRWTQNSCSFSINVIKVNIIIGVNHALAFPLALMICIITKYSVLMHPSRCKLPDWMCSNQVIIFFASLLTTPALKPFRILQRVFHTIYLLCLAAFSSCCIFSLKANTKGCLHVPCTLEWNISNHIPTLSR